MPLPLLYLCNRVDALEAKIDEKLLELDLGPDDDEGSLAKGQRGALTRWRNEKATATRNPKQARSGTNRQTHKQTCREASR